ncbi:hypothetical protein EAE99_007481 [Botrytis elliptica]|nr:hypothetical protein EAE99_007481 [Botrytis elliptica]
MSNNLPPSFSARPVPVPVDTDPYRIPLRNIGLPTASAKMLWEFEKGLYFLALYIEGIDRGQPQWQASPIRRVISPRQKILDILLWMSRITIRAAITGKLHNLLSNPSIEAKLVSQFRVQQPEPPHQQERPVIYALIHCSSTFKTPTKREYLRILNNMDVYIKIFVDDRNWAIADVLANNVDRVNPGVEGRNWNGGLDGKALENWTFKDGWTRQVFSREIQHYRHGSGQEIPYLLEACTWQLYREKSYLLRYLPIINIPDPNLICFGEHIISILASSYSIFGGLNGTLGGPKNIETNARNRAKASTWDNGLRGLEKQDVYSPNKLLIERQLSDRQFYENYKNEGSEMDILKEQIESLKVEEDECEEAYQDAKSRITTLSTARIIQLEKDKELEKTAATLGKLQAIHERTAALRKRLDDV